MGGTYRHHDHNFGGFSVMSARYTRAMPLVLRGLSVVMPQDFGVARQVGFHWLGKTAARGAPKNGASGPRFSAKANGV